MFSALELKVPPLALLILCAVGMAGIDWLWPQARLAVPYGQVLAGMAALAGVVIFGLGGLAFRRRRTTVNPLKPETASTLVTDGIYAVTRNPMYLGASLVLAGGALFLTNLAAWAGPVVFVLYMNRFQIMPEERAMMRLFGPSYEDYRARVRRWL